MTRSLRKKHLIMWIILTLGVITISIFAKNNIPVFEGDKITIKKP